MRQQLIPPPPKGFRRALEIERVELAEEPSFVSKRPRQKGRKAAGIRYESKVHQEFTSRYGANFVPGPWFRWWERGELRPRWCQPDGLILLPLSRLIIIVEVKYQHTVEAWWKTTFVYEPVIRAAFPPELWQYAIVEVVKWYDPAVYFPSRVRLVADPILLDAGQFGCHIWNGKG